MKKKLYHILIGLFCLVTTSFHAQCSFFGLNSEYCRNAAAVTLTPSIGGGSFQGPGIIGNTFHPSLAGAGTHSINYAICTTNYNVTSGTFSLLTTAGNIVTLADDAVSSPLPIGFPFQFFCTTYTAFAISSNGFLTFDASSIANGCCQGQSLPNINTPNNLVAFAWEDLNPSSGGTITYTTIGAVGNRIMVMTFSNVPHYPSGNLVSTQVQLHENGNLIEIHTVDMPSDGGLHTMGIENSTGTIGFAVSGRNASSGWSASSEMYRFEPINTCISTQTTLVDGAVLNIAGPTTLCLHSSATFTASGTTSYTWNTTSNNPIITVQPTSNTVYTVSGLAPGQLGCIYTETIGVTVYSVPVSAVSSTTLLCVGSTATLTGSGASTYTWSMGGNANTATVDPIATTVYTLYGTSNLGCTDEFVITQNVNTNTIAMSANTTVCQGSGATLSASNVVTYTWSTGSPFGSITMTPATNTTYSILATDEFGCLHEGFVTVSVVPIPNVSITTPKLKVCKGEKLILTGNGATNYTWSVGGTGKTATVIPIVNVPYTYTVMGEDANGCRNKASITVTVNACLGLDAENPDVLEIFPNPSSGIFTLRGVTGRNMTAQVFNSVGALIANFDHLHNDTKIDLQNFAAGVYILQIMENNTVIQTSRLLKE